MPSPVYNNIKGTTAGTPGTGAFTPNAAASGHLAWSTVPAGWMGMVRFEDGSAWALAYSYWNGTTLSRSSTQFISSSTGSPLNLTSSATAAMIVDANEVMSHLAGLPWMGTLAQINTSAQTFRSGAITETGTTASQTLATTNYMTEQPRRQLTSATTANAQAGWSSPSQWAVVGTTAGRGGFEYVGRFAASQLPTGPRLFAGMTSVTLVGVTGEPSAHTAHIVGFAKDSTDTNIQLLVNSNAGSGTKTDTGIPLVATGVYEMSVWLEPGGGRAYGYIYRLDTGAIWYGSTTTDIPNAAATMHAQLLGGLSATTGTAIIMQMMAMMVRAGS